MELMKQRNVTTERFQTVLASGVLSDVFDANADLTQRLAVRQALGLGPLPSTPGRHVVDYDMGLDNMIVAGNYDWKNDDITAKRFPIVGKGKVEFEDSLFHFDRDISSEDAIRLIAESDKENPWQVARIENILAYGAKNPEQQREFPIIGLGSVAEVDGGRYVPSLSRYGSGRRLGLGYFGGGWNASCRFLAVRVAKPSVS